MTLVIMQPYFFPYIGYWQLIKAANTFVIYDDVNFIKQGYINRNTILFKDNKQQFTLELSKASSFKLINQIELKNNKNKLLTTIKQNYCKAPFFNTVIVIIEEILTNNEKNLAKFIGYSLKKISDYLEIRTNFIYSSDIKKDNNLKAQDKVIDICKKLNAEKYINSIGGQNLYSKEIFKTNNIELNFLKTEIIEYNQLINNFIPYLSIIDILMFNKKNDIKIMLDSYKLI